MGSWGVQIILATKPCSKSLTCIISTLNHTIISSTSKSLYLTPLLTAATTPFLFSFTAKLLEKTSILSQNFLLLSLKLDVVRLPPPLSPLHQNCSCQGRSHVYVVKSLLSLHVLLVTFVIIDSSLLLDALPLTWLPDVFPSLSLTSLVTGLFSLSLVPCPSLALFTCLFISPSLAALDVSKG